MLAYCRLLTAVESGVAASGGQVWGFPAEGPLEAVCWAGANLVPVLPPWLVPRRRDEASAAFAAFARSRGRRSSSIVGRADGVLGLWRHLDGAWGPAREIRPEQPSLVIAAAPAVEPDPEVRASMPEQLGTLLPACVSMFVEEVGYSPLSKVVELEALIIATQARRTLWATLERCAMPTGLTGVPTTRAIVADEQIEVLERHHRAATGAAFDADVTS